MNDVEQRPVVGWIGLGDQGAPMAQAIAELGHDLHVWARRPQSLQAVADYPHAVEETVAGLAAVSDIFALCLNDDRDMWEILNTVGVQDALRPGTVVVNHGTGDPSENAKIAQYLEERGLVYLDAPVSGGGPGAKARTLTTMVGGGRAPFEKCERVFATFSNKVSHMGVSGSGQMTKLLNNAMTTSNLKNVVDLVRLADSLGVDVAALIDVISDSSGGSTVMRALGTDITPDIAPHLQQLMRKDIVHFADGVRAQGLDPAGLRDRGLAGADGLVEAVTLVTASGRHS
ncbi:NAD(P)-dependent oxidoreductase [Streptomyces flaveolus]|uniref:NAD(P)-dependent oxidoreductase n=1 Tax=Streptomyces flaveolus TaxID=67297 RepID=UPI0036FEB371